MKIKPTGAGFKYRKGDVVAVRATVKYDWAVRAGSVHLDVDGVYSTVTPDGDALLGLIAPALEDDDRVSVTSQALGYDSVQRDSHLATVRAVRGDNAWIELDAPLSGKTHFTLPSIDLERIDTPDSEFAEVEEAPAVRPIVKPEPPASRLTPAPSDDEIAF